MSDEIKRGGLTGPYGRVVAIIGGEKIPAVEFDTATIGRTGHIDLETGYMVLDPEVPADYALVTITYFKPGGKWYMTEEEKWYRDPEHYSKWQKFDDVPRCKDMIAVCIDTPLGFPHIRQPGVHRG